MAALHGDILWQGFYFISQRSDDIDGVVSREDLTYPEMLLSRRVKTVMRRAQYLHRTVLAKT
jgi:hypothetical protein